jgi:hypothetical protein
MVYFQAFMKNILFHIFKVTSRYYWSTIGEDCIKTVKQCDVCQRSQKKFSNPASKLHPIEVKNIVWHRIGIDLVGPLPETARGNKYMITCTDYFSKWPEAAALKTKSADGMYTSHIHTQTPMHPYNFRIQTHTFFV